MAKLETGATVKGYHDGVFFSGKALDVSARSVLVRDNESATDWWAPISDVVMIDGDHAAGMLAAMRYHRSRLYRAAGLMHLDDSEETRAHAYEIAQESVRFYGDYSGGTLEENAAHDELQRAYFAFFLARYGR